jgi:Domain of unknown function (DUF4189)
VIATTLIAVASSAGASAAPKQQQEWFAAVWASASVQHSYAGFGSNKSEANRRAHNRFLRAGRTDADYQNDCQAANWVKNGWLAFVMNGSKTWWATGWGHTKREALRRAKAACRKEGATGCGNIIVEVYKTHTYDPNRPTEGGLLPGGIPPGG